MGSSARDRADAEAAQILGAKSAAEAQARAQKKAQEDAQPDLIPRAARSTLVVGHPPSSTVRSRLEQRQLDEHPEVLTPPPTRGGSGSFGAANAPLSQREKAERQRSLAEIEQTPAEQRTAAQQYWIDQYNAEVAQQERWAREKVEAQEKINLANEERERTNQRIIAVRLELDAWRASESERRKIWALFNRPESITPEKVGAVIVTLRELAGSRPSWAFLRRREKHHE